MDILGTLIKEKGGELVSTLLQQGFDNGSANNLLREAGSALTSALGSGKIDLSQGNLGGKAGEILGSLNIPALAASVGISPEMAKNGLTAVLPKLLQLLQDQAGGSGGIASLLGGAAKSGDLFNMAKKLF